MPGRWGHVGHARLSHGVLHLPFADIFCTRKTCPTYGPNSTYNEKQWKTIQASVLCLFRVLSSLIPAFTLFCWNLQ